jgi:hypothetical protein
MLIEDQPNATWLTCIWISTFKEIAGGTVVLLKWRYPSQEEPETTSLFEGLKNRLAPTEIASDEEPRVKEIIKEKQVIVKIRCQYCKNLYEETGST